MIIKKSLDKSFKEVLYKYVRPASGPFRCWTLHFNNEPRAYVVHRLKLLLTYVLKSTKTFNEIYNFTDEEILIHMLHVYKSRDYDAFIRYKYTFMDK